MTHTNIASVLFDSGRAIAGGCQRDLQPCLAAPVDKRIPRGNRRRRRWRRRPAARAGAAGASVARWRFGAGLGGDGSGMDGPAGTARSATDRPAIGVDLHAEAREEPGCAMSTTGFTGQQR